MYGIKEAIAQFLPDGFEPALVEHEYGRPKNICELCLKMNRSGFVMWDELDECGYETSYSFKCTKYPCDKYPEAQESMKQKVLDESRIPDEYRDKTVNGFKVYDIGTEKAKKVTAKLCAKCMKADCRDWLYLAGQSGSGKTHLACAVGTFLIKKGKVVKMFSWPDLMREVKNFDYIHFEQAKETEVLILDDLYKGNPTPEEKKRTFELIDFRRSHGLQTIVTTERENHEMNEMDSAVIGRIVEACNGFWAFVPKGQNTNFRLNEFLS